MSGSKNEIVCPQCKASHDLRGRAMTIALTCKACGIYFRTNPEEKVTEEFSHSETPVIPVGAKGRVDGYLYEVMGFAVKQERRYAYQWREYFLFNPFRGYAFLSEYNGHWNFIWPVEGDPRSNKWDAGFYNNGEEFKLYQKYQADVVCAHGEFFFDVVDLSAGTVNHEYISPPNLFALERSDDSLLWCQGEYFTAAEVADAFSLPRKNLPKTVGIGYTQPLSKNFSDQSIIFCTLILLLITFVLHLYINNAAQDKVMVKEEYSQAALSDQKMFVTPSFVLDDGTKNLEIYLNAPLSNDWFFGEFTLVNEDDGTEYNFTKEIEFYSGYEGGESWSEGSRNGEALLSQIPSGRYHLNIYPEFSPTNSTFSIEVRRDVPIVMNFYLTLLGILAYPMIYFLRRHNRERKRWEDSDYSPYHSE